jgi:hypothetical protein
MFGRLGAKIWKKNGNEKNGGENDEIWGYFGREWRKMAAKHGCNRDRQKMGATENIMNKGKKAMQISRCIKFDYFLIYYTQKTCIICKKEKKSLSLHPKYINIASNLYDIQFISISVGLSVAFRGILHDSFVEESSQTYP